jgi:hypothetical protein
MDLRMMSNQPETTRLTALRARTDGQLIALINRRLDFGLRCDFANDFANEEAERIYREVSQLLPVVYGASRGERRRLEAKLARLGASLQNVCTSVA